MYVAFIEFVDDVISECLRLERIFTVSLTVMKVEVLFFLPNNYCLWRENIVSRFSTNSQANTWTIVTSIR